MPNHKEKGGRREETGKETKEEEKESCWQGHGEIGALVLCGK